MRCLSSFRSARSAISSPGSPTPARFGERHPGCRVTCVNGAGSLSALAARRLPRIRSWRPEEGSAQKLAESAYATYCPRPVLHRRRLRTSADRFSFCRSAPHRRVYLSASISRNGRRASLCPRDSRPIRGALCGDRRASDQRREMLEQSARMAGHRRLSEGARLSRHLHRSESPCTALGIMWTHIPHGVEDETGLPAQSKRPAGSSTPRFSSACRAGSSWLAWAAACPAVVDLGLQPSDHGICDTLIG